MKKDDDPGPRVRSLLNQRLLSLKESISKYHLKLLSKEPKIHSFRCDTPYILEGGMVMFSWEVENAYKLKLSTVGKVTGRNTITLLAKKETSVFLLTAYGYDKEVTKEIKVVIHPLEIKSPNVKFALPNQALSHMVLQNHNKIKIGRPYKGIVVSEIKGSIPAIRVVHSTRGNFKIPLQNSIKSPDLKVSDRKTATWVKLPLIDQHKLDEIKNLEDPILLDI